MFAETRRAAWAEISLTNIVENFKALRELTPGCEMIASVKANAYGHGSVKVAWELVKAGAEYLAVATLQEAAELREAGIRLPLVMYGAPPRTNARDIIDLGIIPVLSETTDAKLLADAVTAAGAPPHDVFIAIETGMGRSGFLFDEYGIREILTIGDMKGIRVKGLFSHFATADDPDPEFALRQIATFKLYEDMLASFGMTAGSRSLANTAGILNFPQAHFEIVRPGLALYGLFPTEDMEGGTLLLKPAMSVKANVIYLRRVPAGFSVGYGRRFTTRRESVIGTLPIGYADGLPRSASGHLDVLVRGRLAPVVGNICMDYCMVDLTDIPGAAEYDEVVIMGVQGGNRITAEEVGRAAGTINYEIVTRFGQRLPRIYI